MACPGTAGLYSRPATILTRSTLTPTRPSGLDATFTVVWSRDDTTAEYRLAVVIAAMCGSRASAV